MMGHLSKNCWLAQQKTDNTKEITQLAQQNNNGTKSKILLKVLTMIGAKTSTSDYLICGKCDALLFLCFGMI